MHARRACRRASTVGDCVRSAAEPIAASRLGETEVEHLHHAVRRDLDVRRLQIAVDDAFLVRRLERLGDLPRDRAAPRRAAIGPRCECRAGQRLALDQLEHERADAVASSRP